MLVLERTTETGRNLIEIYVPERREPITVQLVEVRGRRARLGILAAADIPVLRGELTKPSN